MPPLKQYARRDFDWISLCMMLCLACIGALFIFSATYRIAEPYSLFFKKQIIGIITGLGLYVGISHIDYRRVLRWSYYGYYIVLGLLVFTLIKGHIGMGAQRWINLGLLKLQPSELTKLLFPGFVGFYMYIHQESQRTFSYFMPLLSILAISFILIRKQPDLGTALIVLFSGLSMFWVAGLSKRFFITSLLLCCITAPILWHYLKPYQQQRVLVFLGYGSSHKERYQIEQSKIAIGSGGLFGKGLLQGTQNRFSFLPESRTDFIFAVLAEEIGFLGASCIILLYIFLFMHLFSLIMSIKNSAVQVYATGLLMHIVFSTLVNICMVVDLLPVVGIPLPLMSYGISNLWTTCLSLGMLNGIAMQQFYIDMHASASTTIKKRTQ